MNDYNKLAAAMNLFRTHGADFKIVWINGVKYQKNENGELVEVIEEEIKNESRES